MVSPQAPAKDAQPAEILVEVNGRRVPVKVYDSRLETAPRPPAEHHTKHGEHVHNVVAAPMQGNAEFHLQRIPSRLVEVDS